MIDVFIGITDRTVPIFIPDPASTTGAGKAGLAAAAITVVYSRYETDNDVVATDVTSSVNDLSALTDAHNDWGWKEVHATLAKGQYRLDLADAVFAAGAWYAVVQVTITSGTAAATPMAFRLIARNDLTDIAQTGDSFARIGAAGVGLTQVSIVAGGIISGAHAAAELNAMADALLDRNMTTGADNGTDSGVVRTVRQALRRLRNREAIAGGVGTIYKEDDTTASWTYAATTAAGDPLSEINPT